MDTRARANNGFRAATNLSMPAGTTNWHACVGTSGKNLFLGLMDSGVDACVWNSTMQTPYPHPLSVRVNAGAWFRVGFRIGGVILGLQMASKTHTCQRRSMIGFHQNFLRVGAQTCVKNVLRLKKRFDCFSWLLQWSSYFVFVLKIWWQMGWKLLLRWLLTWFGLLTKRVIIQLVSLVSIHGQVQIRVRVKLAVLIQSEVRACIITWKGQTFPPNPTRCDWLEYRNLESEAHTERVR